MVLAPDDYPDTIGGEVYPQVDRYYADPRSTGYNPYCDPDSLYYDMPSCEDMIR